jgi:hypothetical protein
MHTKWLDTHGALLRDVAGRDVRNEVRSPSAVLHLTYVDPEHAATSRRRHDAWTTGDTHDIAYRPRIVLVVENRDSRLWFPRCGTRSSSRAAERRPPPCPRSADVE